MAINLSTVNLVPNSQRVLVTGENGFVGTKAMHQLPGAHGLGTLQSGLDLRQRASLHAALKGPLPTHVLHLAGLSFVPDSFKSPETTFDINFLGTLRLLEALAERGFSGRFLFVSSGDAYGAAGLENMPITESLPLRPRSPYAVSKAAAEALCFQWSQTGPFEVVIARPFNHIGAGQSPNFAISDFARQIARISAGQQEAVINVGNIEVTRDFSDVNDVLRAYALLLQSGRNGEIYNVCSGVERSVRTLLERLLELSGVSAEIVVDSQRARPSEQPRVWGSFEKLARDTGWKPVVAIDDSLLNLYRYWKEEIDK